MGEDINVKEADKLHIIKPGEIRIRGVRATKNKFEMFETIISFVNLIPHVFELAYVQ